MSNNTLTYVSPPYGANECPAGPRSRNDGGARSVHPGRGLAGLLSVGAGFAGASGALGVRTWQVGTGLGTALFPVEDIVELAAAAVGTLVAGWVGLHALVALACVLAGRHGLRWAGGERTVARHAPALVRRLARVAAGAGLGLALTAPSAMALPDWGAGTGPAADTDSAVVLDLGWQPTGSRAGAQETTGAPERSASSRPRPAPERTSLVNRGPRTGAGREPLVVVEPGDTLWGIAADQLATESSVEGPSDAEIAAAVPRWYDANRQALGSNPDLIRPGMVLHEP